MKKYYVVKYSAYPYGHWSSNNKRLTLNDAKKAANKWYSYADTIGGQAKIIDTRTNKDIGRWC